MDQEMEQGQDVGMQIDDCLSRTEQECVIKDIKIITSYIQFINSKIDSYIHIIESRLEMPNLFHIARVTPEEIITSLKQIKHHFSTIGTKAEREHVNSFIISQIIQFIRELLQSMNVEEMAIGEKAFWILEFQSKVSCSMQFIIGSLDLQDDITTRPKEEYQQTWERIESETLGETKNISEKFFSLRKMLRIVTNAVMNEEKRDWGITKLFSYGLAYPKYFLMDGKSKLKSMRFYRRPAVQLAKKIWNLPQNGMTRQMAKVNLKSITTNVKIYIPLDRQEIPETIYVERSDSIQVRVLHNQELRMTNREERAVKKSFFASLCGSADKQFPNIDTIIVHMHGGGFLAMSSRSMQIYTRRWARKLGIPVFSIDYRMPPEHRFPSAPYDCLRVYEFLVNHIHKYMNVRPEKIILAGDSAGGNLVFSLNALIMKNKLPMPHALYAAYPALDLRKQFSPSKMFAFTDPLLYPSMLLLCLSEYLGENRQTQQDPLASPILLTEEYFGGKGTGFPKNWPRTTIQVGAKDPLYDSSIKIMDLMTKAGINCYCQVYDNLPHGFLNLDFAITECEKTIDDSIIHLKKLLS